MLKTEGFKKLSIIILVLLLVTSSFLNFPNVKGVLNYVFIEPKEPSTAGEASFAVTPGQVIMVNVSIQDADAIYGYNITIYVVNTIILEYLECIFSSFLNEPYTSSITVVGGRFTIYAKSLPPATPVSGSGCLVTLFFKAKSIGQTLINFEASITKLIKEDGSQISPSTFKRGSVAVTNTRMAIEPIELAGDLGSAVDVNITAYQVQNLYGLEFKIRWDYEILSLIKVENMIPPLWGNKYFVVKNETGLGYYWYGLVAMYPAPAFNGNFTFARLRFNVTGIGLTLMFFESLKLGDTASKPIISAKLNAVFSNVKTAVAFSPSEVVDYELAPPDSSFAVNITVNDAVDLKEFKIKIAYPSAIINFVNVTFNDIIVNNNYTSDNITGTVDLVGSFLVGIVGNITIATAYFMVVGYGDGKITVRDTQTYLRSSENEELMFKSSFCRFINWRNVRIDRFDLSGKLTGNAFVIDSMLDCAVVVTNVGAREEVVTLNVTYVGNVEINETLTSINGTIYNGTFTLAKFGAINSSVILTFSWNTSGLEKGVYNIFANVIADVDNFLADNIAIKTVQLVFDVIDISIANVLVMPPNIYAGNTVSFVVILLNLGGKSAAFDLIVYLDGNLLQKIENITLLGGTGDFKFLTLAFSSPGSHTLNFTIPAIPKEATLRNNVYIVPLNIQATGFFLPYDVIIIVIVVLIAFAAAIVYLKRKKH